MTMRHWVVHAEAFKECGDKVRQCDSYTRRYALCEAADVEVADTSRGRSRIKTLSRRDVDTRGATSGRGLQDMFTVFVHRSLTQRGNT